jgi:hypothetical protein
VRIANPTHPQTLITGDTNEFDLKIGLLAQKLAHGGRFEYSCGSKIAQICVYSWRKQKIARNAKLFTSE